MPIHFCFMKYRVCVYVHVYKIYHLYKRYCARFTTQKCLILYDPMDCSSPGSSVHGIFQAKILEWVAISPSRGSSWPRGGAHISCNSCTVDGFFTTKPLESPQWASAVGKIPIFLSKVLHNDIYASKKIWYKDHPCNHYQFGLISYCYYY